MTLSNIYMTSFWAKKIPKILPGVAMVTKLSDLGEKFPEFFFLKNQLKCIFITKIGVFMVNFKVLGVFQSI